jgi:hypothetical protein
VETIAGCEICPLKFQETFNLLSLPVSQNWILYEKTIMVHMDLFKLLIWTYGVRLWITASAPNIEILQRYQNKVPPRNRECSVVCS